MGQNWTAIFVTISTPNRKTIAPNVISSILKCRRTAREKLPAELFPILLSLFLPVPAIKKIILTVLFPMSYIPHGVYMDKNRKNIVNRLKRIEGQIRGLQRLVESEAPCVEVITQISAVTSAMKKTGAAILANNMKKCIDESNENRDTALMDFQTVLFRYIDLS